MTEVDNGRNQSGRISRIAQDSQNCSMDLRGQVVRILRQVPHRKLRICNKHL